MAYEAGLAPEENDQYFESIALDDRDSLKGRFGQLAQQARHSIAALSAAREALDEEEPADAPEVEVGVY